MGNETRRRRVLVIAYYFPPLGLSGVQRTLKFVKYLPSFGWEPTVLTVEDRGYFARDEGLLAELDGLPVEILRTPSLDPLHLFRKKKVVQMPSGRSYGAAVKLGSFFLVPDNKIGWRRHALRAARAAHERNPFDLIFATAPPFTGFLIARDARKQLGLPLVLDYRDPWLENPLHSYPTPLHRFLHHRMEMSVLRYAHHIVTINRRMKELTLGSSRLLSHNDVTILPQGFDPADFEGSVVSADPTRMHIVYTGTFYIDRRPDSFLEALSRFFERTPRARGQVMVSFAGTPREEDRRKIAAMKLDDCVHMLGYLPHSDCVRLTRSADVLWLTIGSSRGMDVASTGKLYEYLAARKPILASVPEGEARRTLEKSGVAFLSEPTDVEAMTAHLETLHARWRAHALPAPADSFLAQFDRRHLTGELAKIFANVLHEDQVIP